jgi:hypothetical protein
VEAYRGDNLVGETSLDHSRTPKRSAEDPAIPRTRVIVRRRVVAQYRSSSGNAH